MEIDEIETKIDKIRSRPLQLLCLMPSGKMRVLTVRQCWTAKARFLHVVADDLDQLLGAEFGGDNERI